MNLKIQHGFRFPPLQVTFDGKLTQRLTFQIKVLTQGLSILASWFSDL